MYKALDFFVPALLSISLYKIIDNYIQGYIHFKEIMAALLASILFFMANKLSKFLQKKI